MKKILNTILLTLAIIGLTSCSDNGEGEYTFTNSIRIVSQTVSDMNVKASEGTIVVEASASIEVKASADWFTASASGNTITVKTTDNLGIEYRSGKVVIKSGSDIAEVAVIQKGTIISVDSKDILLNDAKAELEIPYACNLDFKCYTAEKWLTCKAENGVISVNAEENATGHLRSGYIYYEAGNSKDSIFIQQCDIEKDLLGDMLLTDVSGTKEPFNAKFVASTDTAGVTSYALVLSDYNFVIPVSFNEKTYTITLNAGQPIGKFQDYNIYTVIADATNGNMTANEKVSMSGDFFYDEEDEATYLVFEDNGTWSDGNTANALVLYAYDGKANPVGSILTLPVPYLIKPNKK